MRTNVIFCMLFLLPTVAVWAQIPNCSGSSNNLIYLNKGALTNIQNYNPALAISASNPLPNTIQASGPGLAVNKNINAINPAVTFYSTTLSSGNVYFSYYNGTTWINTGHQTGNNNANIAGGGKYLYGLTGISSTQIGVWQYDGTGNANLLITLPTYSNAADIVADCLGNFYIFNQTTATTPWKLQMFNPDGKIVRSWDAIGLPSNISSNALPGLAILGNRIYLSTSLPQLWEGIIIGNNVHFSSNTTNSAIQCVDFANCPATPLVAAIASIDTGYDCGQGVPVKAFGDGPFQWSILSGNATIVGTGSNVIIKSAGVSKILLQASSAAVCGQDTTDTITVIGPIVLMDAGLSDTIHGCGSYRDTLNASFSGNPAWLNYQINWTPQSSILFGNTTLTPIVQQNNQTKYQLVISTPSDQGGCMWIDFVDRFIQDHTVKADFFYDIKYGCTGDSVIFTNSSTSKSNSFRSIWDFGNGSVPDTSISPRIFYSRQDLYDIKLIVNNSYCSDSVVKPVNILHPLEANFVTDKKGICKNDTVSFDGTGSIALKTIALPTYFWSFGDGKTGLGEKISHVYEKPDNYDVMMVITDFIQCTDTTWDTILPDHNNMPFVNLGSDSTICNDEEYTLPVEALRIDSYIWSDNSDNDRLVITTPGRYFVTVFNKCGEFSDTVNIAYKNCKVWLPTAFSPNGDGRNDFFRIRGDLADITEFNFSIYNRFGERVFHSNNPDNGWNGYFKNVLQPIGTYYYQIIYRVHDSKELLKGDVILLK